MDPFGYGPLALERFWQAGVTLTGTKEDEPLGLFTGIDFERQAPATDYVASIAAALERELDLPSLEEIDLSGLEEQSTAASSNSACSLEHDAPLIQPEEDDLDVWTAVSNDPFALRKRFFYSWESFTKAQHEEPASTYLSEAGGDAFDAALAIRALKLDAPALAGVAIGTDPLLKAVLGLAMARSSLFFEWDADTHEFTEVFDNTRAPGHSIDTSQAMINLAMQCGYRIKKLQAFTTQAYRSRSALPTMVALAKAAETLVFAVEAHLIRHASRLRTFAQLAGLLGRPAALVHVLFKVIEDVKRSTSDADATSKLFEHTRQLETTSSSISVIFKHVLRSVALPCLRPINTLIGLSTDSQHPAEEYQEQAELPSFIEPDLAESIDQLGNSLRLLRMHLPEHPLCRTLPTVATAPQLDIRFDWPDIHRICAKAETYERSLSAAVLSHRFELQHAQPDPRHMIEKRSAERIHAWESFVRQVELAQPLDLCTPDVTTQDPLEATIFAHCEVSTDKERTALEPELPLCPSLCFSPILAAQKRLVNSAVLRLIFRSNCLRAHLELQQHFHLLGNGSFVIRLTSALFDPSRATTERRKGIMRANESLGLRLGAPRTWPPASSELQLALMSILADCYRRSALPEAFQHSSNPALMSQRRSDLPGGLSFSIRQLPPIEADRCMDANSLYALDFLRLQYTAPSPIDAVITPEGLEKYDTIFKALLRLHRMVFVVSHLPRQGIPRRSLSFAIEARHFVTSCAAYFSDTGVAEAWSKLRSFLSTVEERLKLEDEVGQLSQHASQGLEDMRRAHEQCLDRIMFSLLLRKRHVQVMALLEDIFGVILAYAKDPTTEALSDIHSDFSSKVLVFIKVCRGLVGKQRQGQTIGIERLLLALEMNKHYDKAL